MEESIALQAMKEVIVISIFFRMSTFAYIMYEVTQMEMKVHYQSIVS